MDLFNKFIKVFEALEREEVDYILIGGFAVILYGLPRVTEDIDLFIKPDENNIKKLKKALYSVYKDESIEEITFDMLKEYAVVRYGSPDGFHIDLSADIGEAFTYTDISYELKKIEGQSIKIATRESLYNMKKDTVRPIDKSDSLFLYDLIKKDKN